jgi:hypothetical protein
MRVETVDRGSRIEKGYTETVDGQSVVKRDRLSTNPPRFQVGQEVVLLYLTKNPQTARLNKRMIFSCQPCSDDWVKFSVVSVWCLLSCNLLKCWVLAPPFRWRGRCRGFGADLKRGTSPWFFMIGRFYYHHSDHQGSGETRFRRLLKTLREEL